MMMVMAARLLRASILLWLATVFLAAGPTHAQAVPDGAPDYSIPNGHFFTQAAPGQHGAGYRVANEAAIPLWDEFQRHGGVGKLGYPVSRRFIWKDRVVQRFQSGVLVWRGAENGSEIKTIKDVGNPPEHARGPDPPHRLSGDAERYPWSGWWWPANYQVGGPRLFDNGGPLAKYDRYVESLGRPDPNTLEWEQSELIFSSLQWAGHCNGWAAAALLEPEPTQPREVNGQVFSVADQKGLLTSYHFADAALWAVGSFERDASPAEFHRLLLSWLGGQRRGLVLTFRLQGEEVWSYPAFKFETVVGPDKLRPATWIVQTTVWLVDNDVPANFVGGRPWPSPEGKSFEYTLTGDLSAPDGGEWSPATNGRFGRPFMVWYPDPKRRNLDRQLASPALDYAVIAEILGRDGSVFEAPPAPAPPPPVRTPPPPPAIEVRPSGPPAAPPPAPPREPPLPTEAPDVLIETSGQAPPPSDVTNRRMRR